MRDLHKILACVERLFMELSDFSYSQNGGFLLDYRKVDCKPSAKQ